MVVNLIRSWVWIIYLSLYHPIFIIFVSYYVFEFRIHMSKSNKVNFLMNNVGELSLSLSLLKLRRTSLDFFLLGKSFALRLANDHEMDMKQKELLVTVNHHRLLEMATWGDEWLQIQKFCLSRLVLVPPSIVPVSGGRGRGREAMVVKQMQ